MMQVVNCRNSRGKFASGRKVTGIDFMNVNVAMVTTNDSRIRFIDLRVSIFCDLLLCFIEWKSYLQDKGS